MRGAILAHMRTRLAALAAATLFILAVLAAVFSARFALMRAPESDVAAVLSEIVYAPIRTPEPTPVREASPRVEPTPENAPPEPAPVAPLQPPASSEAPLITNPIWISRPANPERFYPRAAFMRGVDGRVDLDCFVETDGRLTCEVASEAPTGHGFGDAALALARAHTMQPATRDGASVRARYRMSVPFSAR